MADQTFFPRFAADLVRSALRATPVVAVTGPRRCGKTTLVRDLVADHREFITLDDETVGAHRVLYLAASGWHELVFCTRGIRQRACLKIDPIRRLKRESLGVHKC